jgi:hypothetical protein
VLLLCEAREAAQLAADVQRERTQSAAEALAHVRRTFGDTDDEDVIPGASRLSLLCPLSLARLGLPARAAGARSRLT